MRILILTTSATLLAACSDTSFAPSKQQPLDFEHCERIAKETFDAGDIRHDLCPGYMPNGQKIEQP